MGEGAGEGAEGGADGGGEAGAGLDRGWLDAEDDDAAGAVGEEVGELGEGGGMGAEVARVELGGIEAPEGARGEAHVGGIEEEEEFGAQAADEAGEVFRGGFRGEASPVGVAEGSGEDGAEGVVAVAGIADAEEGVHARAFRRKREEKGSRKWGGGAAGDRGKGPFHIMVFTITIVWCL